MSDRLTPGPSLRLPIGAFALVSLAFTVIVVAGFLKEERREWKSHQTHFKALEIARAITPRQQRSAQAMPIRLQQIVLHELDAVDRCTSCHLGVEDPTYAGADQPYAYHPGHDQHPFDRFGCTVCHGGQGRATSAVQAHGEVEFWDQPMLPLEYIQASCGRCHEAGDNPAAPILAEGRRLFENSGCLGCHKVAGEGGTVGPVLDRSSGGERRSPDWLNRHFIDPAEVVPGSAMPRYGFDERQAKALTMYMLSLRLPSLGGYHASRSILESVDRGERLFESHGCLGCHSIAGEGGNIGPSLDDVASRRTEGWMVRHFRDPESITPGTIMPQFGFSEADARSLVLFLRHLAENPEQRRLRAAPSPEQRGETLYKRYGCRGCHGLEGAGGVPNRNAQSGEEVPALRYVQEAYTVEELREKISLGVGQIARLDPEGANPPLNMPAWRDKLTEGQIDDLIVYLMSIFPEDEALDW